MEADKASLTLLIGKRSASHARNGKSLEFP
jgi:hypothetical protein